MCGIAGVVPLHAEAAPATAELLEAMCATLTHRGPDEQSVDVVHGVGLGMRRLSIIDLAGGGQPLYNEDRTVRAIHNGEIYNFQELRSELQRAGHRFRSHTDGEVLVHLWEDEGAALASSLNGMFACAIHDGARRRLAVIRDRIGIKPLFYAVTDEYLVFASEVKAVLASGLVDRELDLEALGEFLAWEYVPAPRTLLRDVRKLEAGSMLLVDLDRGSIEQRQWWRLPEPDPGARHSPGEWEELVDAQIRTCVQRRLISDVPLGALLSGGVDSSLVAAAMDVGEGTRPRAFSIGFEARGYDELEWARRVARHLGLDHQVEILEPRAAELFDPLMHFMDDPIADFSIFPTYLVSRMARQHVTVALSGDGGDELFGGYETYVAQEMARLWARMPTVLRAGIFEPAVRRFRPTRAKKGLINKAIRFVEGLGHDPALEHARWRLFAGDALRRALFTDESFEQAGQSEDHVLRLLDEANGQRELERRLYADLRSYLVDNCLVKIDRMSMACSLEVRVPMLDHELVELAFNMPSELKVRGRGTKILLKRVAARHVPRECVYRPKEGFSMPVKEWLRGELRERMEQLLASERLLREGLFRPATVERLMAEHQTRQANHSHVLWALMVFQDWRERWLEG